MIMYGENGPLVPQDLKIARKGKHFMLFANLDWVIFFSSGLKNSSSKVFSSVILFI